jgi:hypothetical protein
MTEVDEVEPSLFPTPILLSLSRVEVEDRVIVDLPPMPPQQPVVLPDRNEEYEVAHDSEEPLQGMQEQEHDFHEMDEMGQQVSMDEGILSSMEETEDEVHTMLMDDLAEADEHMDKVGAEVAEVDTAEVEHQHDLNTEEVEADHTILERIKSILRELEMGTGTLPS